MIWESSANKGVSMKLIKKLLGIAAITAVIGFIILPLTGCPAEADDGGSGDNSGGGDGKTHITVATITITAPAKDEIPATTISQEQEHFTAGTVTWSPNDNPFKGETIYTATVTLTAKSGYTFTGLTSANATINGNTADLTNNTGETVTLSYIFPVTLNKAAGEAVNAPTLSSTSGGGYYHNAPSIGSATINDVTTNNGQNVEYGISTTNNASDVTVWQDELTFSNLIAGLANYYFIFARSKENANYLTGTASAGLPVTIPLDMTVQSTTEHLGNLLASLLENTTATPYTVKLLISHFVDQTTVGPEVSQLINNPNKYVYLDLSDSTFTDMRSSAFREASTLIGITLPNSLTSIQSTVFENCTNLSSVNIGIGVTSINASAFRNCTSLTVINLDAGNSTFTSENGIVYTKDKTTLVAYPPGKTGSTFTIPNSVTSLGNGAFMYSSFTSITIPNNVSSIGAAVFMDCTSLTSVRFERVGTTIGTQAFINAANSTSLQTAYTAGGIGTYTRPDTTSTTWTKISD
jgi:hypothetical protein